MQPNHAAAGKDTTCETKVEEIRAYFRFMIIMGSQRLLMRNSTSTLHLVALETTLSEISRYLHFVDNSTLPSRNDPGYHRLQKVLPLIIAIKERCVHNYNPHPQNSIDEPVMPFKDIRIAMKICKSTAPT